jgi:hypothetical protein
MSVLFQLFYKICIETFLFLLLVNIIKMIKSKDIRLAKNVACGGALRNAYRVLVANQEDKGPVGRPTGSRRCEGEKKWVLAKYIMYRPRLRCSGALL